MKKKIFTLILFLSFTFIGYTKVFYGPHLTDATPWINKIVVFNSNIITENFTLKIYNLNGDNILDESYQLNGLDKLTFVLTSYSNYQPGNNETKLNAVEGSFTISTESDCIKPLLSYQFGDSESISQFLLSSEKSYSYLIPNGDLENFSWSGIAIMNPLDTDLSISLSLYKNNQLAEEKEITILKNSKYVDLLENIFSNSNLENYNELLVSANSQIPTPILITGNETQDRHLFFKGKAINSDDLKEYTLFSPLNSTTTYLMDNQFNIKHTWESTLTPGNSVYLLDDMSIMRTGKVKGGSFNAGGAGGAVQNISYDGELLWDFRFSSSEYLQHHDIAVLPNGNVLIIAWQSMSESEALNNGRNPTLVTNEGIWIDSIVEVKKTGLNSGEIVWQWKLSDHIIQDYDSTKVNYGIVENHPELINFNFSNSSNPDFTHVNSINYNEKLDQILISVHNFSEIWIIDHSTTTEEAKGHTGGIYGKGGDLLYRWGNPAAYKSGLSSDQLLFLQHDAMWIPEGYPGENHILVFNNGGGRIDGNYSSIEEIVTPINQDGNYEITNGSTYLPDNSYWTYKAPIKTDFYAKNISGAQRLKNGNTLICDGPAGYFFEINENNEIVWEYFAESQVFRAEKYYLLID